MEYAVRVCGADLDLKLVGVNAWDCLNCELTIPGCAELQFSCNMSLVPTLKNQAHPQPTPSTHTPPARIRHQPQLTRNRQRSPVRPRRTVKRNAAGRSNRQCPRRCRLRTEPASTVCRCRLQSGFCRCARAPGTEANTHSISILYHRHNRRPSWNLASRPPAKVARQATALHSRTRWQQVVQLLRGK